MNLGNFTNKKIVILGLGIENYALVNFLLFKKINCEIIILDKRDKKLLGEKYSVIAIRQLAEKQSRKAVEMGLPRRRSAPPRNDTVVTWKLGKDYDKNLDKYDIIFRSPGWPLFCPVVKEIKRKNKDVKISSSMKLFFDLCPTKNIVGVTGTKGKGTTSSLIYEIIKKFGKRVFLGGNIGVAPFEFINKIKKNDWVVLEISSFQLEDMGVSPKISVITNFYSEHLAPADPNNPNYHKNLKDYWNAKMNIIKWQKMGDIAVINKNLKSKNLKLGKGKKVFFTKSDLETKLPGEHNKENIAAAEIVARAIGVNKKVIAQAVKNFKGLEHRLELVKNIGGIKYYNDTFATTPESTMTALKSFNNGIILIAGGSEKNSDFKELAKVIKQRVKYLVLINASATLRLKNEILKVGFFGKNIKLVYNMKEAVKIANANAIAGDIVLLSPACASFGIFKNYKERGKLFKKEVEKYGSKS